MASIVGKLKTKRRRIEEILKAQNQREGAVQTVLEQLKADFGVSDVDEAKAKRDTLNEELDNNETKMAELDKEMATILEAAGD